MSTPSIDTAHLRRGYGAQAVNIERFEDEDALSSALAARVLDTIVARPSLVLGLPTGRTPLGLYRELRERSGGDRSIGRACAPSISTSSPASKRRHPNSYRAFMQAELFDHVSIDPANIGFLNGAAPDLEAECRRYEEAIEAAGGIDLQILGIGANGHIGFNEPADGLCAHTHVAELEQESREANAQWFGGDWTRVPERALSMGMATILNARADRADRDRRGEGRCGARHGRRIDHDAAAGVDPAGAPARDGDARSAPRAGGCGQPPISARRRGSMSSPIASRIRSSDFRRRAIALV